jgi:hypothetical protein
MLLKVIIHNPNGTVYDGTVDTPAEIRAKPGFVYEFPEVPSSQIEFATGGHDDNDLIIVLPAAHGQITLLGFQGLVDGDDKPTLRWRDNVGDPAVASVESDGGSDPALVSAEGPLFDPIDMGNDGSPALHGPASGIAPGDADAAAADESMWLAEVSDRAIERGHGGLPVDIGLYSYPGAEADNGEVAYGSPSLSAGSDAGKGGSKPIASIFPDDFNLDANDGDFPGGGSPYTPSPSAGGSLGNTAPDATATAPAANPAAEPNILDGTLVTDTSGGGPHAAILTVVSAGIPVNAHAKLYVFDGDDQQQTVLADAGFDLPGSTLNIAFEDANSVQEVRVKSLDLEGAPIHDPVDDKIELRSDADTRGSADEHFAFTAVITPDDPTTAGNEGTVIQDVTFSADGTNTGGTPNNDALSDPGAAVDYLWGGGGNDVLTGAAGFDYLNGGVGVDQLVGGAGDDLLAFDPADIVLNGGTGTDILRIDIDPNGNFAGAGNNDVDLTGNTAISDIEAVLLTEDAAADANTGLDLTISAQDVLNFTDASNTLYFIGSAGDTARIGGGWTLLGPESVNGAGFEVYTQNMLGSDVTLKFDDDVTVILA